MRRGAAEGRKSAGGEANPDDYDDYQITRLTVKDECIGED